MSAVIPLMTEIRKIEPKYSGAARFEKSCCRGVCVVLVVLRVNVCAALHEKTSDIKFSIPRGHHERSHTTDDRN